MYSQTRSRFTQHDYRFIADVLGGGDPVQLREDSASVTRLLHSRVLFERTMTAPPLFLGISPQLFFYVFIYQALENKRLADDDVVDYVAAGAWSSGRRSPLAASARRPGATARVVDLSTSWRTWTATSSISPPAHRERLCSSRPAFPDYIFRRSRRNGGASMALRIGRPPRYRDSAEESRTYDEDARRSSTASPSSSWGSDPPSTSTDAYLSLGAHGGAVERIERQAATLDEESFRQSLEL
jgi:hypothetical protein